MLLGTQAVLFVSAILICWLLPLRLLPLGHMVAVAPLGVLSAFQEVIGQKRQEQSQPNLFYQKNMDISGNFCSRFSLGQTVAQDHCQLHRKIEK